MGGAFLAPNIQTLEHVFWYTLIFQSQFNSLEAGLNINCLLMRHSLGSLFLVSFTDQKFVFIYLLCFGLMETELLTLMWHTVYNSNVEVTKHQEYTG